MKEVNIITVLQKLKNERYFFVIGDCPELMSFTRLLDYAEKILEGNIGEEGIPYVGRGPSIENAFEIIHWFGEEVYEVSMEATNSINFIIDRD